MSITGFDRVIVLVACSLLATASAFSAATAPKVSLSPSKVTFSNQNVGSTSASQKITLSNGGPGALSISSIVASGDFAQTNSCGATLAAGANCVLTVTFTPTAAGSRSGTITVTDNGGNSPQTASLSGTGVAPAPKAAVSPARLTFLTQVVGTTSAIQTVTLANSGNAALAITSIVASGDYAQTNTCGSSLAAGANCSIAVTFTPTVAGSRAGNITITDNAANSPQPVALSGTGQAPAPRAALSPGTLSFASQTVGVASTSQALTLANSGTGPLAVSKIATTGDFAQTNNCGTSVAAAASCTINVTFTPTVTGKRNGTIAVTDNYGSQPQSATFSGAGVLNAPVASLTPTKLSFASQAVGSKSAAQTITLANTGTAALAISMISLVGDFAQTNTCGASLAAGARCTISVTFSPTAGGNRASTLNVTDNASPSMQSVSLSGVAFVPVPVASLSPAKLSFASQNVGSTSAAQTLTLSNSGTAALNIGRIAAAGDFAQTNTCGASVAIGASCTISVTFTPTAGGTRNGTVAILDNAAGSTQSATLTGVGVALAPGISLNPTKLSFASLQVGAISAVQNVTLTNTGKGPLTISKIATTGDFVQKNMCGTSIAAGASCAISVRFSPKATGNRTGTLTVTDNAAGSPQSVSLSGTGLAAPGVTFNAWALDFSPQTINTTSAVQTLVLTNSGTLALNITQIAATGDFAQTNTCGTSVAAGASCNLSVTFTPTAIGARSGAITLTDNAPNSPQSVSLTGNGLAVTNSAGCVETGTSNFPGCLSLGSPTQLVSTAKKASVVVAGGGQARPMDTGAGSYQSQFAAETAQLAALLDGSDTNPAQTLATLGSAINTNVGAVNKSPDFCFGPSMYYANDPDAGSPNSVNLTANGRWGGGDSGIWTPTDTNGQACAAAELNYLLSTDSGRTQLTLAFAAEIQFLAGTNFPTDAGQSYDGTGDLSQLFSGAGIANVNITAATVSYDGTSYQYNAAFSVPENGPNGTSTGTIQCTLALKHTPGGDSNTYSGVAQFGFDDGTTLVAGTTRYSRTGATHLDISARDTFYPTGSTPLLDQNGEIDPGDPNFTMRFSRIGASFDPTSALTAGSFLFALQINAPTSSGPGLGGIIDTFQLILPGDGTGSAYYGYGSSTINGATAGSIDYMFCSRQAGVKQSYAQFQPVSYDSNAGQYVPSATVAPQIRYAPTASCTWTDAQWNSGAPSGFWYDRTLEYSNSMTPPATPNPIPQYVVADPNDPNFPFALFGDGTTQPQTLITAAGYVFPVMF